MVGLDRRRRRAGSTLRLALMSTAAFASQPSLSAARPVDATAALTIEERVARVRQTIGEQSGGPAPAVDLRGPTTAQWPNWPNWLNGWPNWGNFWRNF